VRSTQRRRISRSSCCLFAARLPNTRTCVRVSGTGLLPLLTSARCWLQGNALGRGPMVLHLPMRLLATIRQRAAPAIDAANSSSRAADMDLRSATSSSPAAAAGETASARCLLSPLLTMPGGANTLPCLILLCTDCHLGATAGVHMPHPDTCWLCMSQGRVSASTCRVQLVPCCLVGVLDWVAACLRSYCWTCTAMWGSCWLTA
jgi:hypothetical protein